MLQAITGGGREYYGLDGSSEDVAALTELQGLTFSLLAGAAANTKINLAAIRQEDTVAFAMNNNAGVLTDITNTITIADTVAGATITVVGLVAGNTVTIDGYTFTALANTATKAAFDYRKFYLGLSDTDTAANLAAAINGRESQRLSGSKMTATPLVNVVTLRATISGVGGVVTTLGTAVRLVAGSSGTAITTLTAAAVAVNDTFSINGVLFTGKADPVTDQDFLVVGTNTEQAAVIADVINAYDATHGTLKVLASAALAVVTITPDEGDTANDIDLVRVGAGITLSGALLAGGTVTGGIKSTGATNQVLLVWYNKH
jgi:hypothetical protein